MHARPDPAGPGGISPDFLWAIAPATDLLVPELQQALATSIATAVQQALSQLQPVVIGTGMQRSGMCPAHASRLRPALQRDGQPPRRHLAVPAPLVSAAQPHGMH